MGLALGTTFGIIVWVTLWSLGVKAYDGIILTALIILIGASMRSLARFLPGRSQH